LKIETVVSQISAIEDHDLWVCSWQQHSYIAVSTKNCSDPPLVVYSLHISCRDEGVILKDLDSKWEPSDRSTKWLKLKPDYIHSESDLDVLIIG
jgi:ATP-dependent DNA ligase